MDGLRILLVDDDPAVCKALSDMIAYWGYRCIQAEDGKFALAILEDVRAKGEAIDGIIMDIRMPNLDGYGFLEEIEKRGITTPVIAITAFEDFDLSRKHGNLKLSMKKPLSADELQQAIKEAFNP